jgi:hypothetical protein
LALLHQAQPVLLDLSGGAIVSAAQGWAHRVGAVVATIPEESVCGLLIRPDGYVAWAADDFDRDGELRLQAGLRRWFGSSG